MTCMWRGPQPRANTRHHSQPKAKTLEASWGGHMHGGDAAAGLEATW